MEGILGLLILIADIYAIVQIVQSSADTAKKVVWMRKQPTGHMPALQSSGSACVGFPTTTCGPSAPRLFAD